ncbi:unnamed protein product [Macrosiphum euphorbiae]|nr:unnamed protein product [Macrosiphum euphorbiae]
MRFKSHYAKTQEEEEEESVDNDAYDDLAVRGRKKLITLTDNSKMVVRNKTAVVRVPYFVASTDPENFYYNLLLQYMPYHLEPELLEEFNSSKEAFMAREETLKRNSSVNETDNFKMLLIKFTLSKFLMRSHQR